MVVLAEKPKKLRVTAATTTKSKPGEIGSRQVTPRQNSPSPANWYLPLFGIGGLVLASSMVFGLPLHEPMQVVMVASILSLSVAAIASAISGIITLNTGLLRVSGPFVAFMIVFWAFIAAGAPGLLPDLGFLLGRGSPRSTP
jgi:hypothetical protein